MIRKVYHVSLGSNTTMIQFSCLNSSTQLARGLQIQRPHIVASGKHRSIPLCLELLEKPVGLNLSRDFLFYGGLTLAAHQRGTKLEVQQEGSTLCSPYRNLACCSLWDCHIKHDATTDRLATLGEGPGLRTANTKADSSWTRLAGLLRRDVGFLETIQALL